MPPSALNIRRRNLSIVARRVEKLLETHRAFTKEDVDAVDKETKALVEEWQEVRAEILNVLEEESA